MAIWVDFVWRTISNLKNVPTTFFLDWQIGSAHWWYEYTINITENYITIANKTIGPVKNHQNIYYKQIIAYRFRYEWLLKLRKEEPTDERRNHNRNTDTLPLTLHGVLRVTATTNTCMAFGYKHSRTDERWLTEEQQIQCRQMRY